MLIFVIFFMGFSLDQINLVDSSNLTRLPRNEQLNPKIYGGREVSRTRLTYRARIEVHYNNNTIITCGGCLIVHTKIRWVVTAAHCVEYNPSKVVVTLGAHNLSDPHERGHQISKRNNEVYVHDKYDEDTYDNDIALIRLGKLPLYSDYVTTVRIPRGDETFAGQRGRAQRWGLTKFNKLSEVPRRYDVIIIANEACTFLKIRRAEIKDSEVCTIKCLRGSCEWGPWGFLTSRPGGGRKVELLGFVSIENNCSKNVGLFTRISSFSQWIDFTIDKVEREKPKFLAGKKKENTSEGSIITTNLPLLITLLYFK